MMQLDRFDLLVERRLSVQSGRIGSQGRIVERLIDVLHG